ncbi:MAG TPA: hypothetical protein VGJ13_09960 [Pseudonocardiaceae bacterium]
MSWTGLGSEHVMNMTSMTFAPDTNGGGVVEIRATSRHNHWILLDSTWAKFLGVHKTDGVYQIRSRELMLKLVQLQVEYEASLIPTPTVS